MRKTNKINVLAMLLLLVVSFSSCDKREEKNKALSFTTIWKSAFGVGSKQNKIINSQEEWEDFLMAWPKWEIDSFSETEIDFDRNQIIIVIDEVHPDTSWSISITRITEYSDNIIVTVQVKTHDGNRFYVETHPYHIVKIPVITKSIEFIYIN